MAVLRLAACAVLLCLLLLVPSSSALRWLSDSSEPESNAAADGYRTAYHFRPTKNWQNGTLESTLPSLCWLRRTFGSIHAANRDFPCSFAAGFMVASSPRGGGAQQIRMVRPLFFLDFSLSLSFITSCVVRSFALLKLGESYHSRTRV
jgi:hypothetical protein